MSAKKSILVLGFLFLMASASAQTDFQEFYRISRSNNNTGMIILGSWAVLNMATGARGMAVNTGSVKYFHQMNLFWNTVNLGIAGFALVSGHLADDALLTSSQMMEKHLSYDRVEHLALIDALESYGQILKNDPTEVRANVIGQRLINMVLNAKDYEVKMNVLLNEEVEYNSLLENLSSDIFEYLPIKNNVM